MKFYSLITFFIISCSFGQTIDHVQFEYDAAGNQSKRYVIDILADKNSAQNVKDVNELTSSDLKSADIYKDISYYPNPVKEELYLKWINSESNFVKVIELYSMSGQILKSYSNVENGESITITFSSYPEGFYNLILVYNSGEKKSLKILKK